MCDQCDTVRMSRRGALTLAGLGTVAAAFMAPVAPAMAADGPGTSLTPDQALAQLEAGNRRYVASPEACVINMTKRREEVAGGQAPWATVVSCADSRVPPELIFGGLSLGELFVVRNAGNTVDTAALGTLEYGAAVLKSPLIVVMGHQSCGAVQAACDVVTKNATYPGAIGQMIEPIVPAAIAARAHGGNFIEASVRENVLRTVRRLKTTGPLISDLAGGGKVKIVGAYYHLASGKVDFLG